MTRLAIIDHVSHELLIEDVNDADIEAAGDEQAYINQNYTFEGDYSWDYIVDTEYFPEGESDPLEVEFRDLV